MSIDLNIWKGYFKDKFELDRMLNAMIWYGNVYVTGNNAEIESDGKYDIAVIISGGRLDIIRNNINRGPPESMEK